MAKLERLKFCLIHLFSKTCIDRGRGELKFWTAQQDFRLARLHQPDPSSIKTWTVPQREGEVDKTDVHSSLSPRTVSW